MSQTEELLQETTKALERVQNFDPKRLVRQAELGKYAFTTAVAPTAKLVELFGTLPASHLRFFPDQQLTNIRDTANSVFHLLDRIENFDIEEAPTSVSQAQQDLVSELDAQFQHVFNNISPLVAFSVARSQDFAALEREARAAVQTAKDSAGTALKELTKQKEDAEGILAEVRAAAAEQGVSQQAIHFNSEADEHGRQANLWLSRSIKVAVGLVAFALFSLFLHKIPFLVPASDYDAIQLSISKVLIFAVIAYMLILCAKNYLSHRHNEVVNRHRQNALATYGALVEAASDRASSDIVLAQAAACIFEPQETGYVRQEGARVEPATAMQLIPRIGQIAGSQ